MADKAIEVLLDEKRNFPPPKVFKKSAHARSASIFNSARKNPQAFWAKAAKELDWFKPWKKVLEWDSPWAKWFIGGKINASYNCLDRHVKTERKNKAAIIWEGEPGDARVLTYRDVWREVNKFANVLKGLGVKKGDRVCIYMGMVPELVIAMHGCNRIGAPTALCSAVSAQRRCAIGLTTRKRRFWLRRTGAIVAVPVVPLKRTPTKR